MTFKCTDTLIEQLDACTSSKNNISIRDRADMPLSNGVKADFGDIIIQPTYYCFKYYSWGPNDRYYGGQKIDSLEEV